MDYDNLPTAKELCRCWETHPRWEGIRRAYAADDVVRLRGSLHIESTLARRGADRLWRLLYTEPYVAALGVLARCTGRPRVRREGV